MVSRPVVRFQYIPAIALALSFVIGGYVYNRTFDSWLTDIVSDYMIGLLEDVNHDIREDKVHFYDLAPHDINDFLDELSQSSTQRRFTLIHETGKVLGDSQLTKQEVQYLNNYSQRPEVISAIEHGQGIAKRFSTTSNQEVLYVATRVTVEDDEHDQLYYESHQGHEILTGQEHILALENNASDELIDEEHLKEHENHERNTANEQLEHNLHSSVYILRLAMPITLLNNMSEELRLILYLLMGGSMGVLVASSWFSQQKITQVIDEERQQQQIRIDKSTREIELLRQLANMLAACKDINESRFVIKDIVPRILDNVDGCISIMRESQNLMEVEIDWGESWPAATTFSPHDCWAMRKGKAHLSRDKNQNLSCNHMNGSSTENTTLCIPLSAHGHTVGVFHLNFSDSGYPVSEDTKQLAYTLAEHLGLALANLRFQEKLRSQALRDPLTGLYNRRYFDVKLEKEWFIAYQSKEYIPLSVLMLDLDHFKRFNDNFGHDAGDYVLKEIGNLLNSATDEKSIACRLGGEEFAIICPSTSEREALALANFIIEAVRSLHLNVKGLSLGQLGISVGSATYPDIDVSDKELVKLADIALYKAKKNGRSQAVQANQNQGNDGVPNQ